MRWLSTRDVLPCTSFCIQQKQPDCHYRKKLPPTAKTKASAASPSKAPSSAKQPVGPSSSISSEDMVARSRQRHASSSLSVVSLKRCHLSVSPATGLVGMQENAFLNDYFECMGFLPLASASMVRQAVVQIMLASRPQKRHEKVTGYLRLARHSLAECFDDSTVETARAYIVMAILHGFLGEEEKKMKYIAFANSMVAGMPPGALPTDIRNLLLTMGDASKLFLYGASGSDVPFKLQAISEESHHILAVKEIVHDTDICNLVILSNRILNKALHTDMVNGESIGETTGRNGDNQHNGAMEGVPGGSERQNEHGGLEADMEWERGGLDAPLGSTSWCHLDVKVSQNTPRAGEATKTFIDNASPDLGRLSRAMERSDTCSGVGGLIHHGDMAFVHLMKGDMRSTIKSINICARVVIQFPGICRFRPHLVHCLLAGAASLVNRVIYDPVREAYNLTLTGNATPAPPLDEWSGMSCICDQLFCRFLQLELHNIGFRTSSSIAVEEGDIATPASRPPPSGPGLPLVPEETNQALTFAARAKKPGTVSMEVVAMAAIPPGFSNEVALPPPIPEPASPKRRVDLTDVGGAQLGAGADVPSPLPSENERVCGSGGVGRDSELTWPGDILRPSVPGERGEDVVGGLSGASLAGNKELDRSQTTSTRSVPSNDPNSTFVDSIDRCHTDIGSCGGSEGSYDVAFFDNITDSHSGFFGREWESTGLELTEEDLMDAAEALTGSSRLDD